MRFPLVLIAAFSWLATATLPAGDYLREIETARVKRVDRLTQPFGWLTLIGRFSLPDGESTIGSSADNRIRLPAGPGRFGTVTFPADERGALFSPAAGDGVQVNGAAAPASVALSAGSPQRRPTFVTAGTVGFYLVDSGGEPSLHVRDLAHPALVDFPGLEYFPVEPGWRIEARWVRLEEPRRIQVTDVSGGSSWAEVTGKAVFRWGENTVELLPLANPDGSLLFVFADATSGRETYAMRFLASAPPRDGKVVLDFNLAENPPCAFSTAAICPLPPRGNRLPFAVRAGEKAYHCRGD